MCHHKNATRKESSPNAGNNNECIFSLLASLLPMVGTLCAFTNKRPHDIAKLFRHFSSFAAVFLSQFVLIFWLIGFFHRRMVLLCWRVDGSHFHVPFQKTHIDVECIGCRLNIKPLNFSLDVYIKQLSKR